MKILHIITNTELGGAQRVCIDLCNMAVSENNSVAVASMANGYLWNQLDRRVIQYQIKNLVKPISPKKDILVLFELRTIIKNFQPDIIHLHSSKAGVLGRLASIKNPKHIVYTVHGFDSIRLKHRIFLPIERLLQNFCGAIIGVSEYDKEKLLSEGIYKNVSVIYNGISEDNITKAKSLPCNIQNKKIIISIARISSQKNFPLFIEVAKNLQEYTFIWIGNSSEHSTQNLYNVYSIPENVILLGDIPGASNYINLCDLFVLFSHFEGLPMTIIEAMSQKKAIVASNVGGIPELIDSSNGVLVSNNVEEICSAIKNIIENKKLLETMNNNSYKKYHSTFTLKTMWKNYKLVYYQLINHNKK